ncbi:MAG TPA: hypothetical protein VGL99_19355 [Chloroflexota bacterium]
MRVLVDTFGAGIFVGRFSGTPTRDLLLIEANTQVGMLLQKPVTSPGTRAAIGRYSS